MTGTPQPADAFVVRGGRPLVGTIRISGATKNCALKLMAAALLTEGTTVLGNAPPVADLRVMVDILEGLGARVRVSGDEIAVTVGVPDWQAPCDAGARIRASISVLGPLVARVGRAYVARPGGDSIGSRGVDMHLRGLEELGATVIGRGDHLEVRASGRLRGAGITLDFPSVGATENLIMAATLAEGRTVVDNAAREPEVQELCRMLVAMGARISGIGSATLAIDGVEALRPVRWTTPPDRIEAGTLAIAAALTGGDVTLSGVRGADLHLPLVKLRAIGAVVEEAVDGLRVKGGELRACDVVTLPYPGFPTDLQPQLMVLLSQAGGTSVCTENIYESRFAFVDQLRRFGADVRIEGHHAVIRGPARLAGTRVPALDVRAGAAAVLAGLVATGTTVVTDVHHVDRGYARFAERLVALGADVRRVPAAQVPRIDA